MKFSFILPFLFFVPFAHAGVSTGSATAKPRTVPNILFRWTDINELKLRVLTPQSPSEFPTNAGQIISHSGYFFSYFADLIGDRPLIYTFDHPVGGMANGNNHYPETVYHRGALAHTTLVEMIHGQPTLTLATNRINRVLIGMEISPTARVVTLNSNPKLIFERIIPLDMTDETRELIRSADIVEHITDGMREFIVLNPSVITNWTADPRELRPYLDSYLTPEAIRGIRRKDVHIVNSAIRGSILQIKRTITLIQRYLSLENSPDRIPPQFRSRNFPQPAQSCKAAVLE